jgi:hypothetical protein
MSSTRAQRQIYLQYILLGPIKQMRPEKHLLSIKGENNYSKFQPELMNGKGKM